MISRGLSVLHTVLFKVDNREQLVEEVQRPTFWLSGYTITESPISAVVQMTNRARRKSDRDRMEKARTPFPFNGDVDAPPAEEFFPPLAWAMIWQGTYSNLWGHFVPGTLHRWGYVFWDEERVDRADAETLILMQWNEHHNGVDPRINPETRMYS